MARSPVDELRELDRRDTELRRQAARLGEVDAEIALIRGRAEAIDEFFATYRDEETHVAERERAALAEVAQRTSERDQAQVDVDRARDESARLLGRRRLERAIDHVAVAEASADRARTDREALELQASALPGELVELEERAQAVAAERPDLPASGSGPASLVDWASRAHAAVFVAAGSVDTQRERVIREANELATSLLGEPTYGSTVAQVTERVEAAFG